MNCPSCGRENPKQARFCLECGTAFAVLCPSCGANLPAGAKFCLACGARVGVAAPMQPKREPRAYTPKHLAEKILTSRSALEGEHKQVTVLFADVKGSMELAEALDPETWHRILEGFFEILTEGVHRFEGTVNQYTGDGIMALFGAPIAHEDHAQRACYAALHLRNNLRRYADGLRTERGLDFGVRIGLNSGVVVVGKIGDDLRMDYTAQGHTVGLAQRVEQLAESGSVYLSDETRRLVEGFFALKDLGEVELKGVSRPIRVNELERATRLRTRLEVSSFRGLTRFVGRRHEMETLEEALAQAERGQAQAIGVVGEAGVGKSRLCLEFVERCRSQGIPVYETHCPAHGKTMPFLAILELFRSFFGITDQDPPDAARRDIADSLLGLDPSFEESLPLLFDFLGVGDSAEPVQPMDPEVRQRQLFDFVEKATRARSGREPAVILIDDLHWVDPGSDAFVGKLVDAIPGTRTLLLLNFRPEYQAGWTDRSHYRQLSLVPLDSAAVEELVESLLGMDSSVRSVPQQIESWTAGNPFFAEEVITTLIEGGQLEGQPGDYRLTTDLEHLRLPSSVQAVVAARIDRLPEAAKYALQTAAVIGREFGGTLLADVAGLSESDLAAALVRLDAGDFVFRRALYPHSVFAFKHPLSHEVAYESQLRERRADTHARVARALERRVNDRPDEQAALLAHHWERAGEPATAIEWHQRAGMWALPKDPSASLGHWYRVRGLIDELPSESATLSVGGRACAMILFLGFRLGASEEEMERIFRDGKALAERAGTMSLLAELNAGYALVRGNNFAYPSEYVAYASEAMRLADTTDDAALQCATRFFLTFGYMFSGRFQELSSLVEETLRRTPDDPFFGVQYTGGMSPRLAMLFARGYALYLVGRRAEATRILEEVSRDSLALGLPEVIVAPLSFLCGADILYGDPENTWARARTMYDTAEKSGTNFARCIANQRMGQVCLANGRVDEAIELLEQALRIVDEYHSGAVFRGGILGYLAEALLAKGHLDEALTRAQDAVEFDRSHGIGFDPQPWLTRVSILVESGHAKAAESAIDDAQQVIDETGVRAYQPHLHECRAKFEEVFGDEASRAGELCEAYRLYTEMDAMRHAKRVARKLAELGHVFN